MFLSHERAEVGMNMKHAEANAFFRHTFACTLIVSEILIPYRLTSHPNKVEERKCIDL